MLHDFRGCLNIHDGFIEVVLASEADIIDLGRVHAGESHEAGTHASILSLPLEELDCFEYAEQRVGHLLKVPKLAL